MTEPMTARTRVKQPKAIAAIAAIGVLVVGAVFGYETRRNSITGTWAASTKGADGATQTATFQFLPDGLMTEQASTSQGSLLQASGLVPFGSSVSGNSSGSDGLASLASAFLPAVRRSNIKSTYSVKDDVVTCNPVEVNMFDAQNQPVAQSDKPTAPTIYRFKIIDDRLTLDGLDGNPPIVLTRQHS